MLDGKTIKTIMIDSSSVCKICMPPTTPKEINNIDSIKYKNMSSITLDCMLPIPYRIILKCWAVRGETNKQKIHNEKKRIQEELKNTLRN